MSGLLEGARKRLRGDTPLDVRLAGLIDAVAAAQGRLDADLLAEADRVLGRAGQRMRLSAAHTVVALAGATGSGKSSTFNALAGVELATVSVRRPTTSSATACVWGAEPAHELLDWLEIPPRHRVTPDSALDQRVEGAERLDGLVLLDLPDHDSIEVEHHLEVERLTSMTDLMVWLLDPQKYADAAIHRRFLAPLAHHREVMLVVLNRVDEVAEDNRTAVMNDVRRLLDLDGLDGVPLLAASARTGEGVPALRAAIADRVEAKAATRARLAADVTDVADRIVAVAGDHEPPQLGDRQERGLVDALSDAAGVPVVVDAVRRATTLRGRRATGWPLTAWLSRLRPDPLKRLHLSGGRTARDVVTLSRTSLPEVSPVQRARIESSVRVLCDEVSVGLAPPWTRAVRSASISRFEDLEDSLDRAVTDAGIGAEHLPRWTAGVRALQWLLMLSALAGGLWLGLLAGLAYLQVPRPGTLDLRGVPVPTLLLLGGVALGVALALVSRLLVSWTARRRARAVERRLRTSVAEVARRLVVEPIEAELAACRATLEGLRRARR